MAFNFKSGIQAPWGGVIHEGAIGFDVAKAGTTISDVQPQDGEDPPNPSWNEPNIEGGRYSFVYVGGLAGGISVTKDETVVDARFDQFRHKVMSRSSEINYSIETSIAEVILPNLALAFALPMNNLQGSSVVVLNAAEQPEKACIIWHLGPSSTYQGGAVQFYDRYFLFPRTRIYTNGAYNLDPGAQTVVPVRIDPLVCTADDTIGFLVDTNANWNVDNFAFDS